MNYTGWIMAIYDKYKQKYNEKYKNINNKRKFKELKVKEKIVLILYLTFVIIGVTLYGAGIVLNNSLEYIIGTLFTICPPILLVYFDKLQIEIYKRHVRVLREVLEEENINTLPVIERLIRDTSGVLYKIKNGEINNYIKLASSLLFGTVGAALGDYSLNFSMSRNIFLFACLIINIYYSQCRRNLTKKIEYM